MDSCVLLVHGGAWAIPDSLKESSRAGVEAAALIGWEILRAGGSAVEAVEAAVVALEDNPVFDAGRGSVLTDTGEVEMDAMIMDGAGLRSGAVGAVSSAKNPVKLARYIMENTGHTLLVGAGAESLLNRAGLDVVGKEYLVTPEGKAEWVTYKQFSHTVSSLFSCKVGKIEVEESKIGPELGHDTVGCVALDSRGSLAAATSTGGITGKMPGRVGDTPLVGAGGYADNQVGAVSSTGHGESITKTCLAHTCIHYMEDGVCPGEAGRRALNKMKDRVGGAGGLIIINKSGEYSVQFTTVRMAWAAVRGSTLESGVEHGEVSRKII